MEKLDNLTFDSMYSVLQYGMWLLNDLETYLRPLGMSHARLTILLSISAAEDGIISPTEIAKITGKSRPGITRTIERLSKDGYVTNQKSLDDKRQKRLALTQDGEEILSRIIPEYNERIFHASAELTNAEKRQLIRILNKIDLFDDREESIQWR